MTISDSATHGPKGGPAFSQIRRQLLAGDTGTVIA